MPKVVYTNVANRVTFYSWHKLTTQVTLWFKKDFSLNQFYFSMNLNDQSILVDHELKMYIAEHFHSPDYVIPN